MSANPETSCDRCATPPGHVGKPSRDSSGSPLVLRIENMDCPTEEALIRGKLASLPCVRDLHFNLMQRKLTVMHSLTDVALIEAALNDIGMHSVRIEAAASPSHAGARDCAPAAASRKQWWLMGVGIVAAAAAEVVAWTTGQEASWPVMALALIAIAASGIETYRKGLIALKNLTLNVNALMAVAVTGAVAIGQWPEAAMVMVLFAIAEMIEGHSLDRARNAIRGLMAMTPDEATVKQANGEWPTVEIGRAHV